MWLFLAISQGCQATSLLLRRRTKRNFGPQSCLISVARDIYSLAIAEWQRLKLLNYMIQEFVDSKSRYVLHLINLVGLQLHTSHVNEGTDQLIVLL